MQIADSINQMRKRNKVLFTVIVAVAVIMFWKGTWTLLDIVIDEWLFKDHLIWANIFAMVTGLSVLVLSGLALEKLM